MQDACDSKTFNAAVGAGTCARPNGITFEHFLKLLSKHQEVGPWHFAPSQVNARVGQTLLAVNHGGEVHTFTEVEAFGGGIVPVLNELSGNPVPAPECLALSPDAFVVPGARSPTRWSGRGRGSINAASIHGCVRSCTGGPEETAAQGTTGSTMCDGRAGEQ
jgi:hypothetical protein